MARKQGRKNGSKNQILNVRIADSAAGEDGLRVDRQITAIKNSESQTRVVIGDIFDVGIPTTADTSTSYTFDSILNTDDFASLAAQYNLFRVVAIKFDIYDTNPNQSAYNNWGIWHDNYEGSAPAFTRANIADLPDSRVISGGTGQTTLYWVAHGSLENQFNATTTTGSPVQKYGGLKYYVGLGGAALAKYSVQVHAVVDFRGRR
jgi:hypothetical protein